MATLSTTDFRRGLKIEMDGVPFEILEFQHVKPGKGGAFVRTKLKNLNTGRVMENTFRSGEKVGKPDMSTQEVQYLYRDADNFVFMDMVTYEQMEVPAENIGEKGGFLKESQTIKVLMYNGQLLDLDLPASVVLQVNETEPGIQGDRVSGATKPATLETGVVVQVPLFINVGDTIKVDTRTGDYQGRE